MKFFTKILDFLRGLIPSKSDKTNNEKNSSELIRNIGTEVALFSSGLRAAITVIVDGLLLLGVLSVLIYLEPMGTTIIFPFLGLTAILFQYFMTLCMEI